MLFSASMLISIPIAFFVHPKALLSVLIGSPLHRHLSSSNNDIPIPMKKLFVSYSRNDQESVARLVNHLKESGYEVWHDQNLTGGQKWWDNIVSQIRDCDIFLFAVSADSIDSEACRSELSYAVALGKPALPVLIAENVQMQNLASPLSELQAVDYRRPDITAALLLIKAINTSPASRLPNPLPAPPAAPVSYLGGLSDKIDASRRLGDEDQFALCTQLAIAKSKGHSAGEISGMATRLLKRPELLASAKEQIQQILIGLEVHQGNGTPQQLTTVIENAPLAGSALPRVIEQIVRKSAPGLTDDRFYCAPHIPEDKLKAAMAAFKYDGKESEVLVLYDTTYLGTGETGYLITPQRFFRKETWSDSESIEWAAIRKLDVVVNWYTQAIKINDSLAIFIGFSSPRVREAFSGMFLEIHEAVKSLIISDAKNPIAVNELTKTLR